MANFLDGLEAASTTGFTENGALTYTSTLNHNLDFFALGGAKRANPEEAVALFMEAYNENPPMSILNLFYLRDVRGGQGERSIFRMCLEKIDEKIMKNESFLRLIPEYGRWDDLIVMISRFSKNIDVVSTVVKIIKDQLDIDTNSKHPSLLAKWLPLANSVSNMERKGIAHAIVKILGTSEKQLRKIVVPLREKINVVERLMSSGRWPEIDHSHVPSRAEMKYKAAFMKHDPEGYSKYLADVKSGKAKINASCLYPYEIIYQIREKLNIGMLCRSSNQPSNGTEIDALVEMWKALPAYFTNGNVLPVVDVSGSMFTLVSGNAMAIDVSTSLGIYCAQHNNGLFKNHYISFSESPKLIKLNPDLSLVESLRYVLSTSVGYDTNFAKVFELILKTMKDNHLRNEECPNIVLAISDMEFNCVGNNETNFEHIKRRYQEEGYEMPQLVFWNVASRNRNVPVRKDENGVVLVSGMSPSVLRFISEGDINPEKFMIKILLSERYRPVLEVLWKMS